MKNLKNKTVLITGSNRGIGLAFAKTCAKDQAQIILVNRKRDANLEADLKNIGAAQIETLPTDFTQRAEVDNLILKLKDRPVDVLFNNAGLLTGGLLEEQSLDEIYNMFQVNLLSLVHLTHGLLPNMLKLKTGKIINHASVTGYMHFPCASTYAASKAAVIAFSDCLSSELKNTGVSTLCLITPGIKTRMFDEIDKKYSKNFDVPTDSIPPEEYAELIKAAALTDQEYLLPSGATRFALKMAQIAPAFFSKANTEEVSPLTMKQPIIIKQPMIWSCSMI